MSHRSLDCAAPVFLDLKTSASTEMNGACHNWAFVDLEIEKPGHPLLNPGVTGDMWDLNGDVGAQTGCQNILM